MKNFKSIFYTSAIFEMAILAACNSGGNKIKPVESPKPPPASIVTYETGAIIPEYQKMPLNTYMNAEDAKIDEKAARKNIENLLKYAGATSEFDIAKSVSDNGMLWYRNPKDPSAILNVNLSNGDISLNRGTKAYAGNSSTPGLLQKDEAVKAATEHLKKLGYWKDGDNSMVVGHVGGVNMTMHDDKKNENMIYEKLTTVRFDRKLDNIPVIGHSRLLVQMGSKGTIQSLVKQWTTLSNIAIKSESFVTKEDVKKSIEDHLISENKGAKKIIISHVNLIYYDDGHGIIEPALHIIGTVQMPRGPKDSTLVSFKHDMVEPILKNPKMSYTFKGERHEMPKETDDANIEKKTDRSADDKNKK
jgi:hypothetical protein